MREWRRYAIWLAAVGTGLALFAVRLELDARASDREASEPPALSLVSALGAAADDDGFRRADRPRQFEFPADHGAHDGFRTEWWYVTGNLFANDGRAFGYQLTFFRNALAGEPAGGGSAWRSHHFWMAHFALSDPAQKRFRFAERFAREALGLAGVAAEPFRVALEDWSLTALGAAPAAPDRLGPLRLLAREGDAALALDLEALKPPVLQGEAGLSQKGADLGIASYYYSLSRLATRGVLELGEERIPVRGESWLDREWSTSALSPELEGWDWFALQLDDGEELMFYRLRRRDGAASPWSRGSLVAPSGEARPLAANAVELAPTGHWQSPEGARYPTHWRVRVPTEGLELELRARLENQELRTSIHYWEGAVAVTGSRNGRPVAGHGFVELTGYDRPSSH